MISDISLVVESLRKIVAPINIAKSNWDYLIVLMALVLGLYLHWSAIFCLAFATFIWVILNPIASQLVAKAALLTLIGTMGLLAIGRADRAESFAALTYYLIVLMAIMAVRESYLAKNEDSQK